MFDYLKEALKEAKQKKAADNKKKRFLNMEPDYAYLEHLMEEVVETYLPDGESLHLQITAPNGYKYDISKAKKHQDEATILDNSLSAEAEQWRVK